MTGAGEAIIEDEVKDMEGRGRKRRFEDRGRARKRVRQSLRTYKDREGSTGSSSSSSSDRGSSDSSSAPRDTARVIRQELKQFEQRIVATVGEMLRKIMCHILETVQKGEKTMKEMERTVRHLKDEIKELRREVRLLKETGSKAGTSRGTSGRARMTGTEGDSKNKGSEATKKVSGARETEKATSSGRLAGISKEMANPKESKWLEESKSGRGEKGRDSKDRTRGDESRNRRRTEFFYHRGDDARGYGRGRQLIRH